MARERLTRDRVIGAGMEVADVDGLSAVTMRRVAASLDVEAMSLYHYVSGKEALLDGLVEAVIAQFGNGDLVCPHRNGSLAYRLQYRMS